MDIFKSFTFEAAHHLAPNVTPDHRYARLHGHSFTMEVEIAGEPDQEAGWVVDFGDVIETIIFENVDPTTVDFVILPPP